VSEKISQLVSLMKKHRGEAVVLTGAGASVPSGIPDFRGPQGIWKKISSDVFDIEYFHSSPEDSWRAFLGFFEYIRKARPNLIHRILAKLEEKGFVRSIITQNIDGLHQKAGSRRVIELHGNAYRTKCLKCGKIFPTIKIYERILNGEKPIHKDCGGLLKPDVVYFGEPLPEKALREAFMEAREAGLFIVIGSSLVVYPAAQLPVIAKEHGSILAIINLGDTGLDHIADIKIDGDATLILDKVYRKIIG
jgi:NAD-dependent deacetylase